MNFITDGTSDPLDELPWWHDPQIPLAYSTLVKAISQRSSAQLKQALFKKGLRDPLVEDPEELHDWGYSPCFDHAVMMLDGNGQTLSHLAISESH